MAPARKWPDQAFVALVDEHHIPEISASFSRCSHAAKYVYSLVLFQAMTREPFDPDEHVDPCDFLAKTVYETDPIGPIGFVHWRPKVRVKAVSREHENDAPLSPPA